MSFYPGAPDLAKRIYKISQEAEAFNRKDRKFEAMFLSSRGNKLKQPRRVIYIYDNTGIYGTAIYLLNLVRNLDPARYVPLVVFPESHYYLPELQSLIRDLRESGVEVLSPPPASGGKLVRSLRSVINLRNLFKDAGADVVHLQTAFTSKSRKVLVSARLAGVPVLVRTEHSTPGLFANDRFVKYYLKPFDWLTDRIVILSDSNLEGQIKLLGRSRAKLIRSHGGIDLERFKPVGDTAAAKEKIGLAPSTPVAGLVARLNEEKGHTYLIDAAARVIREYGPVNFLLVGEGPLEEELRTKIVGLGLEQYFIFAGYQPDPIPYIAAMDIGVLPSLFESFGLALVEYMAMGKPCVVSDIPSFNEILVPGQSGLMAPVKDPEGLADGILKLLRDKELAGKMGCAARARAENEFSIQRMANDMMALYDSLLPSNKYAPPSND